MGQPSVGPFRRLLQTDATAAAAPECKQRTLTDLTAVNQNRDRIGQPQNRLVTISFQLQTGGHMVPLDIMQIDQEASPADENWV